MSKRSVGESLVFIYIFICSYYRLFSCLNLCLSVILDSLICSFKPMPFLTTCYFYALIDVLGIILDSPSCLFQSISFLTHNICQPTDVVEVHFLPLALLDGLIGV